MQEDAQKDLQEAERKEMAALESRIGPIVKDFFKGAPVLPRSSIRARGIMYADEAVNVTDEVLKRINTSVALPRPADNKASAATTAPLSRPPPRPRSRPRPPRKLRRNPGCPGLVSSGRAWPLPPASGLCRVVSCRVKKDFIKEASGFRAGPGPRFFTLAQVASDGRRPRRR